MKAVLSNRIYMHKTDELMEKLLTELTYMFRSTPNGTLEKICNVININDKLVSIPIGRTDLIPKDFEIIDKRSNIFADFPDITEGIELRDSQKEIYNKVEDNCIIHAKPGYGKTFLALFIAKAFGQKTLVLTHTTFLRDQWVKECEKVFKNIKVGVIGSNMFSIGEHITIANVQTVIKHINKLRDTFGFVICDEVHRLPSNTFTEIIDKLNARYKLGLTGTLGRKDQKHILIPNYISNKIYSTEKENTMEPVVIIYDSKFSIPGNHMIPWATRVNELAYNPAYQAEIVNIVNAQTKRGHKVLILSDRTEFLNNCASITDRSDVVTSKTIDRYDIINRLRLKDEIDSIYGSIGIFKEGISINEFSCVILACPINNVYLLEQVIGRIIREFKGKMQPEVIDVRLQGKTGENQFRERLKFYRAEKYRIISLQLEGDI